MRLEAPEICQESTGFGNDSPRRALMVLANFQRHLYGFSRSTTLPLCSGPRNAARPWLARS